MSSGASCFHLSSLRCFYNLIGVHLWSIQLIGHGLKRHTPVYIRPHSLQCMSEPKPSHEVAGIVHRALRQDGELRHSSGEGYQNIYAGLDTILSRSSTDNFFELMAWFLLWHALSTVGPYIDRCVPFQIISNQLNLPQVDSNQVVETTF